MSKKWIYRFIYLIAKLIVFKMSNGSDFYVKSFFFNTDIWYMEKNKNKSFNWKILFVIINLKKRAASNF